MAKAKAECSGSEYGGSAWCGGAGSEGGVGEVVGKTNCSRLPAVNRQSGFLGCLG